MDLTLASTLIWENAPERKVFYDSRIGVHDDDGTARFSKLRRAVRDGMSPSNARHAVGRKLLTVMWGMWKTNSPYDARLV